MSNDDEIQRAARALREQERFQEQLQATNAAGESTYPASTPGGRNGLPRSAQAATAALDDWFGFQFQGSRSATLLAR